MFPNFQNDAPLDELVAAFEQMRKSGKTRLFDLSSFEKLIDYYLQAEKYVQALDVCETAQGQYPYSTEILINKAHVLAAKGDFQHAFDAIHQAEIFQPSDPEVQQVKGEIYSTQGYFEEAIRCYELAMPLSDEKDSLHFSIGMCYKLMGKIDLAIAHYFESIKINPYFEDSIHELGDSLYIKDEEPSEVLQYFQDLIDADPYTAINWYNLGVLHNIFEEFEKARDAFEYATLTDPQFSDGHFYLGNAYMNLEQFDLAYEAYSNTLEQEGPSAEIYCYMGAAKERQGQYDQALKLYQKSAQEDDQYENAWYGISACLLYKEKWMEAIHHLRKAIKINEFHDEYWVALAGAEYRLGNLQSSLEAFEKAADLNPYNPDCWLNWSLVYYENRSHRQAIEVIKEGLDFMPDQVDLLYRCCAYQFASNQFDEACQTLELALLVNYEEHAQLYTFFTDLNIQKTIAKIINKLR